MNISEAESVVLVLVGVVVVVVDVDVEAATTISMTSIEPVAWLAERAELRHATDKALENVVSVLVVMLEAV